MVIYIETSPSGMQQLASSGKPLPTEDWKQLVGKTIKHVQKIDGKVMFTLK
jgi:hypothetical protein